MRFVNMHINLIAHSDSFTVFLHRAYFYLEPESTITGANTSM